jgi:hypothetical protein
MNKEARALLRSNERRVLHLKCSGRLRATGAEFEVICCRTTSQLCSQALVVSDWDNPWGLVTEDPGRSR